MKENKIKKKKRKEENKDTSNTKVQSVEGRRPGYLAPEHEGHLRESQNAAADPALLCQRAVLPTHVPRAMLNSRQRKGKSKLFVVCKRQCIYELGFLTDAGTEKQKHAITFSEVYSERSLSASPSADSPFSGYCRFCNTGFQGWPQALSCQTLHQRLYPCKTFPYFFSKVPPSRIALTCLQVLPRCQIS